MISLRSIKERIVSIRNIRKITSAMKMVSSAKLHKAQHMAGNLSAYATALRRMMETLLPDGSFPTPLSEERPVRRVAVIAFASDSSLCGSFNAGVIRELQKTLETHRDHAEVALYTIGKKAFEAVGKWGVTVAGDFEKLAGTPDYGRIAGLAGDLMRQFEERQIDRVELIYHRFKTVGSQQLVHENWLPLTFPPPAENASADRDYLLEPSRAELLETLIPENLKLRLYEALLHSNTSEHAVRMISMQTATDNADELIGDLTVEYNKSRQQAITGELLDIISGSTNR
jgi:F-type H+-transporting ATPase subunit gamma